VGPKKDSVELLLEGMPLEQPPPPPRTMPQTAGQASAAYHAEHAVRPAHTSPDDMPKVVVERPPQRATVRLDRSKLQAVLDQAEADKAAQAAALAAQEQQAASMPLSLRIAIAVVAGLAVVLGIFLIARPSAEGRATVQPPPPVALPAAVAPAPSAVAAQPAATASTLPPVSTDSAASMPTAPPPVAASPGSSARPRPRPAGATAPGGSSDLGEFRPTFH
jgi:DNA polymerase-3 subunit gamma/tau